MIESYSSEIGYSSARIGCKIELHLWLLELGGLSNQDILLPRSQGVVELVVVQLEVRVGSRRVKTMVLRVFRLEL